MKNNKMNIVLIVLLSLVAISIIGFMIFVMSGNKKFGNFKNSSVSTNLVLDAEYDELFSKINIVSDASNIEIKESDNEKIKLKIYSEEDATNDVTKNDDLNIELKSAKCIGFCFNNKVSKIELYLPENYESNIRIESNYGEINVDKVSAINIDSDYGDIRINKANTVDVDASYGSIKIGDVNTVKLDADYGKIEIKNINEKFDINSDCGDVEIDTIDIKENSSIEIDLGKVVINNTNEVYFDVEKNLGDVDINNNYNKSDITVKIKSDVGDIKIKN